MFQPSLPSLHTVRAANPNTAQAPASTFKTLPVYFRAANSHSGIFINIVFISTAYNKRSFQIDLRIGSDIPPQAILHQSLRDNVATILALCQGRFPLGNIGKRLFMIIKFKHFSNTER